MDTTGFFAAYAYSRIQCMLQGYWRARARAHLYDTGEPAGVADVLEADGPAGDALALVRVERVDEPDVGSLPLRARRRRRLAVAQTLLQHSETTTTTTQDASVALQNAQDASVTL